MVRHQTKNLFASFSTGSANGCYYPTKGHAINQFDGVLQGDDLWLDRDETMFAFEGDSGARTVPVVDEFKKVHGYARISWHRMDSGNYEMVGYIG